MRLLEAAQAEKLIEIYRTVSATEDRHGSSVSLGNYAAPMRPVLRGASVRTDQPPV